MASEECGAAGQRSDKASVVRTLLSPNAASQAEDTRRLQLRRTAETLPGVAC